MFIIVIRVILLVASLSIINDSLISFIVWVEFLRLVLSLLILVLAVSVSGKIVLYYFILSAIELVFKLCLVIFSISGTLVV